LAFSRDGKTLTAVSGDAFVTVWEVAAGKETASRRLAPLLVAAASVSPDGKVIATAGNPAGAGATRQSAQGQLWDAATGKQQGTLPGHVLHTACVSFAPDGKRLLTVGSAPRSIRPGESGSEAMVGEAKVWDLEKGKEAFTVRGGSLVAAWSPDGKRVA